MARVYPVLNALAIVALGGLIAWGLLRLSGPGLGLPARNTASAYDACQGFVRDRLKSPASAQFPPLTDAEHIEVRPLANGHYAVVGVVDAQNTFGALLRTSFTCEVAWSGTTYERVEATVASVN